MQVARLLARSHLCTSASSISCSSFVGGCRNIVQAGIPRQSRNQFFPTPILGRPLQIKPSNFLQLTCCRPALSGWRSASNVLFGSAVVTSYTSFSCSPANAAKCERDQQLKSSVPSFQESSIHWDEGQSPLLIWLRRLWVPMLLIMTVALGWHYPVSLAVNLVFLLWSTKPTPSSIYIWVEQRSLQEAQQKRGLDRLKAQLSSASTVMHVEVHDYVLFCLARVSSISQKMLVVGILGDWWVAYSVSSSFTGFNFGSLFPVASTPY